jgi:hypothetical protein
MSRRHAADLQALCAQPDSFQKFMNLVATPNLGTCHFEIRHRGSAIPKPTYVSDELERRESARLIVSVQSIRMGPEQARNLVQLLAQIGGYRRRRARIDGFPQLAEDLLL